MSEPIQSIAQNNYILHNIDAKKLYVQEPLFTANSGDAVYVGWRPDETVLWSGELILTAGQTSSFSVNENISAFNSIRVYSKPSYGINDTQCIMIHEEAPVQGINTNWTFFTDMDGPKIHGTASVQFDMNMLKIINNDATYYGYGRCRVSGYQLGLERTDRGATLIKIVGINRKENA